MKTKTPILDSLMEQGIVRKVEYRPGMFEYLGRAADGVEVTLGIEDKIFTKLGGVEHIEALLREIGGPESW